MPELFAPLLGGLIDFGPAIGVLPDIGASALGLDAVAPALAGAGAAAIPAGLDTAVAGDPILGAGVGGGGIEEAAGGGALAEAGGGGAELAGGGAELGAAGGGAEAGIAGGGAELAGGGAELGAAAPGTLGDFGAAAAAPSAATAAPAAGTVADIAGGGFGGILPTGATDPFASAFGGTLGNLDPFAGTSLAAPANAASVAAIDQPLLGTSLPATTDVFPAPPGDLGGVSSVGESGLTGGTTTIGETFNNTLGAAVPGGSGIQVVPPVSNAEQIFQGSQGLLDNAGNTLSTATNLPAGGDLPGSFPEISTNVPQLPEADTWENLATPPTSQPIGTTTVPGTSDPLATVGRGGVGGGGDLTGGTVTGGGWSGGALDPTTTVPITPSEMTVADISGGYPAASTAAAPGATPDIFSAFTKSLAANPLTAASLGLGALGLGAAVVRNLQALPEQKQLQALAAQIASNSATQTAQASALINPLITGQLPPNLAAQVVQAQQDAITQIKARYASMGQPGSSAEINDIAASIQNSAVVSGKLEEQLATAGISLTQAATTGLNVEGTIFQSLMNAQINSDTALAQAIASFAGQSAIAGAVAGRTAAGK